MVGLFIRRKKLNISLVFITQSYFAAPKNIRLNSTHYFIMKISNKREFQQITVNNSSDIELTLEKSLRKMYCKTISFLVVHTTLASHNCLHFRKTHLEKNKT